MSSQWSVGWRYDARRGNRQVQVVGGAGMPGSARRVPEPLRGGVAPLLPRPHSRSWEAFAEAVDRLGNADQPSDVAEREALELPYDTMDGGSAIVYVGRVDNRLRFEWAHGGCECWIDYSGLWRGALYELLQLSGSRLPQPFPRVVLRNRPVARTAFLVRAAEPSSVKTILSRGPMPPIQFENEPYVAPAIVARVRAALVPWLGQYLNATLRKRPRAFEHDGERGSSTLVGEARFGWATAFVVRIELDYRSPVECAVAVRELGARVTVVDVANSS